MWFIGVEVEQETSAPPPEKNPGSAPGFFRDRSQRQTHIGLTAILSKTILFVWITCTVSQITRQLKQNKGHIRKAKSLYNEEITIKLFKGGEATTVTEDSHL